MDQKLKDFLNQLETPHEELAQARKRALVQKQKDVTRRKQWLVTSVALVAICFFLVSIRLSPTIALAVSKVPGLEAIVQLIHHNKGIEDVLEHDYNEQVYETVEQAGIQATIEEVIADETGMYIMYRLISDKDLNTDKLIEIEVLQNGEGIKAAKTYSAFMNEETYDFSSSIELVASEEKIDYTHPNFEVRFTIEEQVIRVPFTLKNEIKQTRSYVVNEQIEVEGQKFTVNEIEISPLRVSIEIAIDPNNEQRILSFNSLELLDENNEVWSKISNGVVEVGTMDKNVNKYYLQSNYFREPKSLTLKIAEIEALPKGQDFIEVDFDKQQVVTIPNLPTFKVTEVYPMQVRAQYKPKNPDHHRQLFGDAFDANGKQVDTRGSTSSGMGDGIHEGTVSYELENVKNPIKIYINSFPNYLKGSVQVKIPLDE
ncbi:DUF4179 domain-containing protein [Solibacillus sp. FSL H8-0523]|uniref:DUF4179 domain-containing protein n=1 Tax=Solibacillus sp. FSL H8-0523 TaxID=2954511 RepID=UPI003100F1DC